MALRLNDTAPDFTAQTTDGEISFHDWIGDGWALLFSHPKDFTPVCTTELGTVAGMKGDFAARDCKIIGISVDGVDDHAGWKADIAAATGNQVDYPLIGDPTLEIVKAYDMLPADAGDASVGRPHPMSSGRRACSAAPTATPCTATAWCPRRPAWIPPPCTAASERLGSRS